MAEVKTNEELMYQPAPVQTQFIDHNVREVQPMGDDKDAPIVTFKLANNTPNVFIDCSGVELMCEVAFVQEDGSKIEKTEDAAGLTNNTLNTLWSDIDVRLNHTVIQSDNHLYPWKALIHQLTTWNQADREAQGKLIGFEVDDDPANMDNTASTPSRALSQDATSKLITKPCAETPLFTRNRKFLTSADLTTETTWKFQGPLHAAPFNTNFIMPPGVDVQIDLRRSEQLLTVMCANNVTAANRFRPKIVDMRMMVKYLEVAKEVYRAKISQIDLQGLSIPLKRFQMTQHVIPNQQTMNLPILRNQKLPSKVFIAFLENGAMSGTANLNPFNFRHYNLEHYEFIIGSKRYPNTQFQLKFTDQGTLTAAYKELLGAIGARKLDGLGSLMSPDKFQTGTTIIGVDLTANMDQGEDVMHVTTTGDMDIYLRFQTAPANCTMLMLSYFSDGAIVLDKHANVSTTW